MSYKMLLNFFLSFFTFFSLALSGHGEAADQMYSVWAYTKVSSQAKLDFYPPIVFSNFKRTKKCKIWPQFRHHSPLSRPFFKI